MQVKTFQANDMPEALRMVKAEFGSNAMILTSRKKMKKGFLGLSSTPYVEVTAAPDIAPPAPAPAPKASPKTAPQQPEMTTKDAFQASMIGPLARELKELRERVEILQR